MLSTSLMEPMDDADTPAPPRRLRRLAKTIALTLVVGLVAAELLARAVFSGPIHLLRHAADPELIFELAPGEYVSDGYFRRFTPVSYSVTDDGCRAAAAEHVGGPPVYLLGSSLMFGIAVDSDDSLAEAIRRAVIAADPAADFEPRNCSVPGYALLQTLRAAELALSREAARTYVIVVEPRAHLHESFDWSVTTPSSPRLRALTDNVRLARLAYLFRVIRANDGFRFPDAPLERFRGRMEEVAREATAAGVHIQMYVFDDGSERTARFVADARGAGFETYTLERPPREAPYLHPDGDHWARAGSERIAEQIAPHLAARLTGGAAAP